VGILRSRCFGRFQAENLQANPVARGSNPITSDKNRIKLWNKKTKIRFLTQRRYERNANPKPEDPRRIKGLCLLPAFIVASLRRRVRRFSILPDPN
jgi:hypothetical protein